VLRCKYPAVFLFVAVLLTSLTGCANSPVGKNLEQSLAADSRLKDNPVAFGGNPANNTNPQPQPTPQSTVQLPTDFPTEIPQYPNAILQEVTPSSTRWLSSDPSNFISSFYLNQFQKNNWEILQRPTDGASATLQARRNDLLLKISIQPKSVTGDAKTSPNQSLTATELTIDYTRNGTQTSPNPTVSPKSSTTAGTSETALQPGNPEFIGPLPQAVQPTNPPVSQPSTTATGTQEFNDLNKAPQQLQQYIKDLTALGVLPLQANSAKSNTDSNQFEPSKNITRREYARWLVAANNAMYANNPAKQIRLASETQAAFSDVPKTNPDFGVIQGLAEAGLIPSSLSGDSTEVLFRPDAPLTREQLILWKLPLDTRQALPTANLDAVKQTWGFQDAGKIEPKALRAVLADFQNGEQSNIRRVFGYTTLFQPKKPVTRAEGAAALWYFGTQGDGVSAVDALKLKQ
jgi:S-layer homology domain